MNRSMRRLFLAGAVVAVPAAINAVIAAHAASMEQQLPGEIGYYDWVHGRVAYYRLGQGPPLLLVHNPHAGGSAWEWRKVFPELANRYTVYALDLLGFGLSDKPNIAYSGVIYADLVHDFLEDVVHEPAIGIGSALGASYLVNVAVRRPERMARLVLANPLGTTMTESPIIERAAWEILHTPVLGETIYNAMTARAQLERELRQHMYFDPAMVTRDVVRTVNAFAHLPGSRFAASAFITGRLDLPIRLAFAALTQPVLLVWGREAYYAPVADAADLLYRAPQARLEIIDECGMLPHDEKAGEFLSMVKVFLAEPAGGEERAA